VPVRDVDADLFAAREQPVLPQPASGEIHGLFVSSTCH
jgi:hypothetical protein